MAGRWLSRLTSSGASATPKRPTRDGRARGSLSGPLIRATAKVALQQRHDHHRQRSLGTNGGTTAGAVRWRTTRARPFPSRRSPRALRPPNPRRLSPHDGFDGDKNDEYRWMNEIGSEEMLTHLGDENRYSSACLKPLRERASELFHAMAERQPEEDGGDRRSVPERLGSFLYYTRRDDDDDDDDSYGGGGGGGGGDGGGKGFPVYVRRPVEGTLEEEQVVLDLNEIEEHGLGGRYGKGGGLTDTFGEGEEGRYGRTSAPIPPPALGSMKLSSDQRMLACTIDVDGSDRFVLAVFDLLASGGGNGDGDRRRRGPTVSVLREDAMWDDVVGVEWGSSWPGTEAGNRGDNGDAGAGNDSGSESRSEGSSYELYYTVPDDLRRPWQVRRVTIHQPTAADAATPSAVGGGRVENSSRDGGGGSGGWRVDSSGDSPVLEEKDDAFFVDVGKTKDHAFVVINVHSKTTSEVYLIPTTANASSSSAEARTTTAKAGAAAGVGRAGARASGAAVRDRAGRPTLLRRRRQGVEYYVDHSGDAFYLVTNTNDSRPAKDDSGCSGSPQAGQGGATMSSPATHAGEYQLVRVPQRRQRRDQRERRQDERGRARCASSLEGVEDAPWEEVPCGRDRGNVQEMDLFRDHCVLYESSPEYGCPSLRVVPLAAAAAAAADGDSPSTPFVVSPPAVGGAGGGGGGGGGGGSSDGKRGVSTEEEAVTTTRSACTLRPGVNSWFDARTARFSLSSPTAPEDVYDLCLETGEMDLLRRTEVPGSPPFDGRDYSCYTTRVPSEDGEMVPLTIAHRTGLALDGGNRLLLHGYGAYGMSLPIDYHSGHACMLERGWVLAFAHVRGGGERGKAWHAAGRGVNKWNSFLDFEACAKHLVSEGFTAPATMGARVNSAGGLLAGVMANQRPGLFSAMVMKAPFLGVYSAMCDTSLPLTVHEFDEWGDPGSSEEVDRIIRSYCPYENVREQEYPALLVTASTNDNRVNVWDPAKWVSRVRAANTGKAPVLLRVSDTDGHHGPGNTLDELKDSAIEMAFLEKYLRVK